MYRPEGISIPQPTGLGNHIAGITDSAQAAVAELVATGFANPNNHHGDTTLLRQWFGDYVNPSRQVAQAQECVHLTILNLPSFLACA